MSDRLTICACRWRGLIPPERVADLAEQAQREGLEVEIIDDLCAVMQEGDEATMNQIGEGKIAACHERAIKSLLAWR